MPHSEIHGSKGARPSPRLIAACHVLHRLSSPRHPSNALESLDRSSFLKAFMHGEDCATDLAIDDTHGLAARERARRCLKSILRLNRRRMRARTNPHSRCHRTAGAFARNGEPVSPTSQSFSSTSEASAIRSSRKGIHKSSCAKAPEDIQRARRERRMVEPDGIEPTT